MKTEKLAVIDEMTSPLFRIMSIHNDDDAVRRQYDNNICAFHIGDGYILSVAHNLRVEATIFKSITDVRYQADIIPYLNPNEVLLFNQCFPLDNVTHKRYMNIADQNNLPILVETLKRINFDSRWVTLYQNQICKPYLIIQQRTNQFYNNVAAHGEFNNAMTLLDPNSQRQTYLIETELIEAFYEDDIALYKIINTPQNIIDLIPSFEIDTEIYDVSNRDFFCVQSAPSDLNPGRMINEAHIDGLIDQYTRFGDRIGGNYNLQGLRYLIKGYFRFGSSGAPYIKFNNETNTFKVNAVQSEACPIQLTIKNDRNGNLQWVNAIATPIANVIDRINGHKNA